MDLGNLHCQNTLESFRPDIKSFHTLSTDEGSSAANFQKISSSRERSNSCVSTQCTDSRGSIRESSAGLIITESLTQLDGIPLIQQIILPNGAFSRATHVNISLNAKPSCSTRTIMKKKRLNCLTLPFLRFGICRSISSRTALCEATTQTPLVTNSMSCHIMAISQVTSFCTALSDSFCEPLTRMNSIKAASAYSDRSEIQYTTDSYKTPCQSITCKDPSPYSKESCVFSENSESQNEMLHSSEYNSPISNSEEYITANNNICNGKDNNSDSKEKSKCNCGYLTHCAVYDPSLPLHTGPNTVQGSYKEALAIAKACCGRWITIIERSESLDSQYRYLGLNPFKRAVMNRLAVPLTMFLENKETVLHCWIHTPLGIRHMRSNLLGEETIDEDSDVGVWRGVTKVVDYSVPWFCSGTTVRALQQVRHNDSRGTCIETRCVLPDQKEGKLMLFNFSMIPKEQEYGVDKCLSADRILRKQL